MGFRLIQIRPNATIAPRIGDLKTPSLNYSQTVADGATLGIDRHCEVIVVANAPKYSVDAY